MNKTVILEIARNQIQQKQQDISAMIADIRDGLANETKSSAGDKYETSRAMSQQELDKLGTQLQETNRQLALIPQLESGEISTSVQNGSLVETSTGFFFIGLPSGQLTIDGKTVFCISPTAPLAQLLLGLKTGGVYSLNGKTAEILSVQ